MDNWDKRNYWPLKSVLIMLVAQQTLPRREYMPHWTSGYVTDIGYTYTYSAELNPLRTRLAFLNVGIKPPEIAYACELGFGQGISLNIHAAASSVGWWGTDFNPKQAIYAKELSEHTKSGATVSDESFAEFATRSDLPKFDFIGMHGVWSWISDENRRIIVEFIRKHLNLGGVLYVGYNTLPGWSSFAPMRNLLHKHAEIMGSINRGTLQSVEDAIQFGEKLLATNPNFAKQNPQVSERFEKIRTQGRDYLAHEFFNRDWHPMYFSTMSEWLEPAKLQYASSANYFDHINALNLSKEQTELLDSIANPVLKESTRDFLVNKQFRTDYWVRGASMLSKKEQGKLFREERVILTANRENIQFSMRGAIGNIDLNKAIYEPILEQLSSHEPQSLGKIESAVASNGIGFSEIIQAIFVLIEVGYVASVNTDEDINKVKPVTEISNRYSIHSSPEHTEHNFLTSPVTGGAILVSRIEKLFLLALESGHEGPEGMAEFCWGVLREKGQKLVKEDKTLEEDEDNLAELLEEAKKFYTQKFPLLDKLSIYEPKK